MGESNEPRDELMHGRCYGSESLFWLMLGICIFQSLFKQC